MILITKAEKQAIVAAYPDIHVYKTVNHYYCEETPGAMNIIRQMRHPSAKDGARK